MFNETRISEILSKASEQRRDVLLETEGFEILEALGFKSPASRFVRDAPEAHNINWSFLSGDKVVVKVISPHILHKSDVGGVAIVTKGCETIASAIEDLTENLSDRHLEGFSVSEFINYDVALGGELLMGLRHTDDFGPVVTVGAGGIYTEFLSSNFKPGRDVAIFSPELTGDGAVAKALQEVALVRLLTNPPRGQCPRIQLEKLVQATRRLLWLGCKFGHLIWEFEINPLVIFGGEPVALDVLVQTGNITANRNGHRPVEKLKQLLEPRSAAVIGVSHKLNPGHIIVNNLLREGFDRDRLYVIKPETEELEGCACVADVASLPERVDLLVVSVAAPQVPETVAEVISRRKAEGIVVIPGGLEEKQGSEQLMSKVQVSLAEARATEWRGPLINGGNCLGIRSRPGRYDTMFIPQNKLSLHSTDLASSPVALISQSGAFALTKGDKLPGISPKYNISLGNQMDVTVGDYLTYLKDDEELQVISVYVEGFKPLDGIKFLKAASDIVASGKTVILYRAGRTPAGVQATSSHTASIAGDYLVTWALAKNAGVVVAETIADFEDLTLLSTLWLGKNRNGKRLGAISNAGFECVAIADHIGDFTLPGFTEQTSGRLKEVFAQCRIQDVVDVHNPLDLTPMANDAAYEDVVLAVMDDENVDVGIVGCVPMTPALDTLPGNDDAREDNFRVDSVVQRLLRLQERIEKPWVAVVDAGSLYDPMTALLQSAGIPTFKTADRALRVLNMALNVR